MTGWCDYKDVDDFTSGVVASTNHTYFTRVQICENGTLNAVRIQTRTDVGANNEIRFAVYSDSGGLPDELLAQSIDVSFIENTILSAPISPTLSLEIGTYVWVAFQVEAANATVEGNSPTSIAILRRRVGVGWAAGFPDPAGALVGDLAELFSGVFIESVESTLPFGTVYITDGDERIDLNNCGRIYIDDWTPFVPGPKGNGTWRDSSLSPGRQLVDWQWENWVDVFNLGMHNYTQDKVIRQEQDLQRLLIKAHQYWTTDWQNEPVWLEVRAPCETHTRYAIIKSWRTPTGSGNPFQQPFSAIGQRKSVIQNFQLTVEHGPWLSDEPGTGRCVQISGKQDSYPFHLEFNGNDGDTSYVDCTNQGALQDLPTANFTVEAWIRADGWGQNNNGVIFSKAATVTTGWHLRIDSSDGVRAFADYSGNDAISTTGTDDFTADGAWHHIAATFDPVTDQWRIWIDGAEASYTLQQAGTVGYNTDAGIFLYMGNRFSGGVQISTWEGGIGWTRLSDSIRYAAAFTPPPRCILPDIDGNTVAQWIGVENSGATIDNQETTAALDGTQTDCEFDVDCEFGRDETCLEEVYIANKHNRAQLTHIFVDDGGVFGGNLISAVLPFLFLPAVPAVNDAVYFGIDTTFDDSGPFCSLVFDILTAQTDVTGIDWEYWNGAAWVPLAVQDNTNADGAMTGVAFDTAGVNSVHWEQWSNWTITTVNGITGYWIRARVTAIGAAPTGPYQQNRDIYSILWPYIEIDDAQVLGDISTIIQLLIANQVDESIADAEIGSMIIGARSLSRGADFSAFINASDEQNDPGITANAGGNSAFQNYIRAPSGRDLLFSPVGVTGLLTRIQFIFSQSLSPQYYGIYHAYVRLEQTGGAAGDFEVALQVEFGTPETTEAVVVPVAGDQFVDLGQVRISPSVTNDDEFFSSAEINILASNSNAAPGTLDIIDLILIPMDEFSIKVNISDPTDDMDWGEYLDIDSIIRPKTRIRTFLRDYDDSSILTIWQSIANTQAFIQPNSDQRIWFFSSKDNDDNTPFQAHTVQINGTHQYLYARGDR